MHLFTMICLMLMWQIYRFVEVWIDMSLSMQCLYGGMVVVYFFCSTGEKFCMYEVVI